MSYTKKQRNQIVTRLYAAAALLNEVVEIMDEAADPFLDGVWADKPELSSIDEMAAAIASAATEFAE